ncbi:cytochrome P450 [Entophlyctis helioformis]|nr:cytochrome P450 [Entophlyctis helioformis]
MPSRPSSLAAVALAAAVLVAASAASTVAALQPHPDHVAHEYNAAATEAALRHAALRDSQLGLYAEDERLHALFLWLASAYGPITELLSYSARTVYVSNATAAKSILDDPSLKGSFAFAPDRLSEGLYRTPSDEVHDLHMDLIKRLPRDHHLQLILDIAMQRSFELLSAIDNQILNEGAESTVVYLTKEFKAFAVDVSAQYLTSANFEAIVGLTLNEMNMSEIVLQKLVKLMQKRSMVDPIWWFRFELTPKAWPVTNCNVFMRKMIHGFLLERKGVRLPPTGPVDMLDALFRPKNAKGSTEDDTCGEIIRMLVHSFQFMSAALAFVFYELLRNPQIDAVWTESKGILRLSTMAKLPFVEAVIRESLRLHPVFPTLARVSKKPVDVLGHQFPKGTRFEVCVAAIHRDPAYWTDPNEFQPERFLKTSVPGTEAYLAFGGDAAVTVLLRHLDLVPASQADAKLPQDKRPDDTNAAGRMQAKEMPMAVDAMDVDDDFATSGVTRMREGRLFARVSLRRPAK